jgi:ATP-dependent protease ClpP protease subunit
MTFEFNASASGTEVDIAITGVIGDGFWSDEPCTADSVREALKSAPNVSLIRALIDTDGGDVWQGFGIYQVLSEHTAQVEVTIGARAQSCGSLVAMAGDKISMHESSKLCVHNPWGIRVGNADQLEKTAKDMRNLQASFVTAYAARSGMSEEDVQSLMNEDRLMDAKEALAKGFCTDVRKAPRKDKGAAAMGDKELTDAMSKLRAKALTSARTLQIAAMAPPQPQPTQPLAGKEQPKMDPNLILAALGLPEGATTEQISAFASSAKGAAEANGRILAALEVDSLDKAVGAIEGLKGASARATKAEADLQTIREETAQANHKALVAAAMDPQSSSPHAGKLTPAQQAWALSVSTETLEGFLAVAPAVLKGDGKREPKASNGASSKEVKEAAPTWNGKTYAALTNTERMALGSENEELFNEMREHAISNRLI